MPGATTGGTATRARSTRAGKTRGRGSTSPTSRKSPRSTLRTRSTPMSSTTCQSRRSRPMVGGIELREDGPVRYSEKERDLFVILQNEGPSDTLVISRKYYRGKLPFNGRKIISGALASLKKKVALN